VHVATTDDARRLAAEWPEAACTVAEALWPGPVTVVVRKHAAVPDDVTAGGPTVAVRVPAHPVAIELLTHAAVPVAAPSANPSGRVSPTLAEHIVPEIRARAACVLDAGPCDRGIESTVLDLTVQPPRILRPGAVSRDAIEALIGPTAAPEPPGGGLPARSPGLMGRHYAPLARVAVVGRLPRLSPQRRLRAAWLTLGAASRWSEELRVIGMPSDPEEYARVLYATLQDLDLSGTAVIYIEQPPRDAAWEAVNDRLRRAALR
jgi:L-threonylcarbamoyladenylate synthase